MIPYRFSVDNQFNWPRLNANFQIVDNEITKTAGSTATATLTLKNTDRVAAVNTTSVSSIHLPSAAPNIGKMITLAKTNVGGSAMSVVAASGENIEGSGTYAPAGIVRLTLIASSSNTWRVVSAMSTVP